MKAVQAAFVEIKTPKFTKKVRVFFHNAVPNFLKVKIDPPFVFKSVVSLSAMRQRKAVFFSQRSGIVKC